MPIPDPDDPLPPPQLIRIELFAEPGEYAVIEAALDLVRQRTHLRRRGALFVEMAALVLSQSDARSRRRQPVVIETDATTGQAAYVTDRGYLPVSTSYILRNACFGAWSTSTAEASEGQRESGLPGIEREFD